MAWNAGKQHEVDEVETDIDDNEFFITTMHTWYIDWHREPRATTIIKYISVED